MAILFITGNQQKFKEARAMCAPYGVELEQQKAKTKEFQTNNIEEVAIGKAEQAYAQIQQPLIVHDAGWSIPALHGFPGAFMRYMNEWLQTEDFLRLMDAKIDRRIFLVEAIAYHDGNTIRTFTFETEGRILEQPRGKGGAPSDKIVCLDQDSMLTIAEALDNSSEGIAFSGPSVWDAFCQAYAKQPAA